MGHGPILPTAVAIEHIAGDLAMRQAASAATGAARDGQCGIMVHVVMTMG